MYFCSNIFKLKYNYLFPLFPLQSILCNYLVTLSCVCMCVCVCPMCMYMFTVSCVSGEDKHLCL